MGKIAVAISQLVLDSRFLNRKWWMGWGKGAQWQCVAIGPWFSPESVREWGGEGSWSRASHPALLAQRLGGSRSESHYFLHRCGLLILHRSSPYSVSSADVPVHPPSSRLLPCHLLAAEHSSAMASMTIVWPRINNVEKLTPNALVLFFFF